MICGMGTAISFIAFRWTECDVLQDKKKETGEKFQTPVSFWDLGLFSEPFLTAGLAKMNI